MRANWRVPTASPKHGKQACPIPELRAVLRGLSAPPYRVTLDMVKFVNRADGFVHKFVGIS